jgi:hypothetical protein
MSVNYKTIEDKWIKPKKDVLSVLEEYTTNKKKDIVSTIPNDRDEQEFLNGCYIALNYVLDKIQELKKENENGRIF